MLLGNQTNAPDCEIFNEMSTAIYLTDHDSQERDAIEIKVSICYTSLPWASLQSLPNKMKWIEVT